MKPSRKQTHTQPFLWTRQFMCLRWCFRLTETEKRFKLVPFHNFKYIDIVCVLRLFVLLFYGKINTHTHNAFTVHLSCKLYLYSDDSQVSGLHFHFTFVWRFCCCGGFSHSLEWKLDRRNISCQFSASCIKLSEQLVYFIRQKHTSIPWGREWNICKIPSQHWKKVDFK